MLKAVLIDDEISCTHLLSIQISEHCPELDIVGVYNDPVIGLEAITAEAPDVLFLDVEMPEMTGFGLLEKARPFDFEVIFTTAYDSYAVQAIKFSALDYLLKPVALPDLRRAVDKLHDKTRNKALQVQLDLLLQQIRQPEQRLERIALSTSTGLEVIDLNNILYCEAQSNYSMIHLVVGKRLMVSKTLKQIDEMLKPYNFFRTHQSFLVNLAYVKRYVRGDGSYVVLEGNIPVSVAQSRKESLMRRLTEI